MRIVWRRQALADLAALQAHIAKDDPQAAKRIAQRIVGAVERLASLPSIGRPGRGEGPRVLVGGRTPDNGP